MDLTSFLLPIALAVQLDSSVPRYPAHDCLIENVLHEARGEPLEGQLAVIEVVLVRSARSDFPDSACSVIEDPYQFSWLNPGAVTGEIKPEERAEAAQLVFSYVYKRNFPKSSVFGATNYLNPDKVERLPDWYFNYEYVGKIGSHEFFKRPDRSWVEVSEIVPY